jgi:hypothetical protein
MYRPTYADGSAYGYAGAPVCSSVRLCPVLKEATNKAETYKYVVLRFVWDART